MDTDNDPLYADYHFGIEPGTKSGMTAAETGQWNATTFNTALAEVVYNGSFDFAHGADGPVRRPIIFGPGNYLWGSANSRPACLYTPHTAGLVIKGAGCGEVIGLGSGLDGMTTTWTLVDPVDDPDKLFMLIRNQWTLIEGIVFYGRQLNGNINSAGRTITDVAWNGSTMVLTTNGPGAAAHGIQTGTQVTVAGTGIVDGTWTATRLSDTTLGLDGSTDSGTASSGTVTSDRLGACFGYEGRVGTGLFSPTSRFNLLRCGIDGCTKPFRFLDGYYDEDDSWNYVATNNHSDNAYIAYCDFSHFDTMIYQENVNSVWNAMRDCRVMSQDSDGILFDIQDGGSWRVGGLKTGSTRSTVLQLSSNSTNHRNFEINFSRDGNGNANQKIELFKFAGSAPASTSLQYAPRVRISGDFNNIADIALLDSPIADFGAYSTEHGSDILFDVRGLDPNGLGSGITAPTGWEVDSAWTGQPWWRYVKS